MNFGILCFFPRHAANIVPLLKAFPHIADRVTLYTVPRIVQEWNDSMPGLFDKIELVVAEDNEPPALRAMLPRMMRDTRESLDILHFDEIPDFWFVQSMRPGCPCTLTVHNMNALFDRWNRLKRLELRRLMYNNRIRRNFAGLNTVGRNQAEYLRNLPFQNKPVFRFPPRVYEADRVEALQREVTSSKEKMIFTIVGSIDQARRNYLLALDAFERVFRDFPGRARLLLLGTTAGGDHVDVIERAKTINRAGGDIVFFDGNIPQPEFERWLAGTDCLVAPMNTRTRTEQYGVTKVAGDLGDRIQWALPIMVSRSYVQDAEFANSTLVFEDANGLYQQTASLLSEPSRLAQLKESARIASENYTLDRNIRYFREEVFQTLSVGRVR